MANNRAFSKLGLKRQPFGVYATQVPRNIVRAIGDRGGLGFGVWVG